MREAIHGSLVVAALLAAGATIALAQSDTGPDTLCSSEDYSQFDFWVGDWIVTSVEGEFAGTNRVEKALNGCVVVENWEGSDGSVGTSLNMFFARDGKWHQTWVDANGGRLDLEGGLRKGAMVLSGTMPGQDGKPVLHQISWTKQPDGTVRQHWRGSKDAGENWRDLFVGIYAKKALAKKQK